MGVCIPGAGEEVQDCLKSCLQKVRLTWYGGTCESLVPALGWQRPVELCEFETRLVYTSNYSLARAPRVG